MASKKHLQRKSKRATIAARAAAQDSTTGKKVKAVPAGRTIVDTCRCRNDYQDGVYGSGRRAFNLGPVHGTSRHITCTSCGARRSQTMQSKGDAA